MSAGFQHDIAGGDGNLVVTSVQSPNFVHGSTGWQIAKDGSAEFNNVVIRGGEVIGGTSLIYSGVPASGTLIASVADTGGTDAYGNAYLSGVVSYDAFAGVYSGVQTGGVTIGSGPVGGSGPWTETASFQFSGTGVALDVFTGYDISMAGHSMTIEAASLAITAPITATSGTPSAPTNIQTDTWHVVASGSLSNGWVNAGGGLASFQYKLLPTEAVHVVGVLSSAGITGTTFFTLPAGYRPGIGLDMPVGEHGAVPGGGDFLRVATSGALTVFGATTTNGPWCINAIIPLDIST